MPLVNTCLKKILWFGELNKPIKKKRMDNLRFKTKRVQETGEGADGYYFFNSIRKKFT